MPITRDQFDKGFDDTRYKTLQFLMAHPNEAYNNEEVSEEVYGAELPSDWKKALFIALTQTLAIDHALNALVSQGLVNKKVIGGSTYYSINRN